MKITLDWRPHTALETKMTFSKDYNEYSRIAKLDFLGDCISLLEDLYNKEYEVKK